MHAYISSLTLMLYISPWEAHRRYILRPGPEQNCYLRSEMQFQILKFPIISFLQPRGSPRPCRITSEQKSRLPQAHFKKPTDWFRHERETKMGRDITWNRKYLRWGGGRRSLRHFIFSKVDKRVDLSEMKLNLRECFWRDFSVFLVNGGNGIPSSSTAKLNSDYMPKDPLWFVM